MIGIVGGDGEHCDDCDEEHELDEEDEVHVYVQRGCPVLSDDVDMLVADNISLLESRLIILRRL